jgi:3-hydroxyisobutyrate dehydrogenase
LWKRHAVTVWNRTREKAERLTAFGAQVADTPADAVRGAERVHLVLKDDAVVDAVIEALRPGLADGTIIVDHTTTRADLTAARAARLASEGVNYLHCPVFIGPAAARQGQGIILASGPRALFDAVQPALATQAARVEYLGERVELAAAHKLMGNCLIIGMGAILADVFTLAAKSQVAPTDALARLGFLNPGNMLQNRGKLMAEGNYAASFELDMARKDVRLMQETSGELPLAVIPAIAARMDALIAAGHGQDDFGVLAMEAVRYQ